MNVVARGFAALAFLASCAVHAAPEAVAFVADLQGAASIEGEGRLRFLGELAPGARLLLGTNATVVVTYALSGAEFTAKGPGEFTVGATELKADKGAPPAKRSVAALREKATVSATVRMATASVRMRAMKPEGDATALVYPVETRTATIRPAFRWRADATSRHELEVLDPAGKVVYKGPAESGVPIASLRLAPGQAYRWSVATPVGSLGEARFSTLGAAALDRARKAEAATSFSGRVSRAMLLHELGARQDAQALWAQLGRERPDLPELAALHP